MDRVLRLAVALAAALLGGCASDDLRINDTAFVPSARVTVPLFGRPTGAPTAPQSGHALEASYMGATGSDKQEVDAFDPLTFNGVTFPAGTNVRHDYSYRHGELLYRWRHFFGASRNFGLEVLGGVGHSIFYLTSSAPGLAASEKFNTTHGVLGVGGIWRFRPDTSLQLRLTGYGAEDEGIGGSRFDLHVVHAVARNIALRAGITSFAVNVNRTGQSDIRASFGGPALGLDINF